MFTDIKSQLRPAFVSTLLLTVIAGLAYPLAVYGAAQVLFPRQANGSMIVNEQNKVVGSELIGQPFSASGYFWGTAFRDQSKAIRRREFQRFK